MTKNASYFHEAKTSYRELVHKYLHKDVLHRDDFGLNVMLYPNFLCSATFYKIRKSIGGLSSEV